MVQEVERPTVIGWPCRWQARPRSWPRATYSLAGRGAPSSSSTGRGWRHLQGVDPWLDLEGADRERDGDVAAPELLPDLAAHVAHDARLVGVVLDPDAQLVGDGAVAEVEQIDRRRGLLEHRVDARRHIHQRLLHPVGRRAVVHADVDPLHVQRVGVEVVDDRLVGDLAVGDDQVVVVAGAQMGGAPGDVDHPTLGVAELDPVVDAKRPLETDDDAGKEVAEDRLQRQTEDQRGHGAGGHQGGHLPVGKDHLEGDQEGDQVGGAHRHRRQQRRQPDAAMGVQMDVEEVETGHPQHEDRQQKEQRPGEDSCPSRADRRRRTA